MAESAESGSCKNYCMEGKHMNITAFVFGGVLTLQCKLSWKFMLSA
jgi:hypothetical protein